MADQTKDTNVPETPPEKPPETPVGEPPVAEIPEGFVVEADVVKRIEDARRQEKNKQYEKIDALQKELNALRKDLEKTTAEKDEVARKLEELVKAEPPKPEEKPTADITPEREKQLLVKIAELEGAMTASSEALEKLRSDMAAAELDGYRNKRLAGTKLPEEYHSLVSGESREEIDKALEDAEALFNSAFEKGKKAGEQSRVEQATAAAPDAGAGPPSVESTEITSEQYAAMSPEERARIRKEMKAAASADRLKAVQAAADSFA